MNFQLGDIVVILGSIDQRVRQKLTNGLVIGTLEQFLVDSQVSVLLENGDLWIGPHNMIADKKEQE